MISAFFLHAVCCSTLTALLSPAAAPPAVNAGWNSTYANPYTTSQGSLFFNMPGAFNSSFRFMRPAMLRGPGNVWKWPENGNLSPFYPTNQPGSPLPATNPTLVTAVKVLNTIYLPKGIDSSGGSAGPGTSVAGGRDLVWWTVLR